MAYDLRLLGKSTLLIFALHSVAAHGQKDSTGVSFLNGVEVRINGSKPLHFGLDTGAAPAFFITPERSTELALPVVGHRVIHTSDKQANSATDAADVVRSSDLNLAGHRFLNVEGVVLPEKNHDGTLGISLFHDVLLTLDYPCDRLIVSDGDLPIPNGRDVIAYTTDPGSTFAPLRVSPTVSLQLAGHPLSAILDTGARRLPADVVVPVDIAATLPLGPSISETTISGASGRSFPAHTAKLDGKLVLGNVSLDNPTVMVTDWLGFVDVGRIINGLALTIDQRNKRVRLHRSIASACHAG